ncbi:hypothetical protein HDE_06162 [Halotydeus destructor]|nr:hypothetical protein HDE_06162 [Halotydeus destructor]
MDIFDFNSLQRTRYHVIAPEMFNDAVATPAFNAFLRGHYHKLNYTVKFVASTSSGYVDENGNYSGLVGMLQRREADMAMHLVLLGGLKDEPVKHDIVRTPADLYIYGSKGLVTNRDTDILDAKDRFDVTTLSYCYFMIHVVCAILALSLAVKSARWLWTRYRQALWKCFGLMVDQEEYRLKPWSSRLLWLHLSVAAFVAVFGYFLSLVSADSIAEIPPRTIDRYDDIFSAHFNKTVFHITTNGFYYDYLKQSPRGTKLGKLMRKLEAESTNCKEWYGCAIANVDPEGAQDFTTFAQRCSSGESALLFPRQGFDQGVAILGCRVIPDLIVGLHRSREMVATGSLTTFRRHGLDDQVERYISYTLTLVDDNASGYADKYGNYSGQVGMIQRKEADFALHMVLLGGLENEPVKHGDVITGADVHVYGRKGELIARNTDIFDVVKSFDPVTLVYYFVLLHILCAVLVFAVSKFDTRWSWSTYRDTCWSYFTIVMGLDNCRNQSLSQRLLWLHLSFSVFFLVFGFFLNLVSTDSIAQIRPRTIDKFTDIFDLYFSDRTFHILKNAFFYNYLKHSPKGKPLAKLYNKLQSNSSNCEHWYECPVIVFGDLQDSNTVGDLVKFMTRCSHGRSAVLFPRQGVDQILALYACRTFPEYMRGLHRSNEVITSGSLTSFHRHGLDERLVRYTSYRFKRFTEMNILRSMPRIHLEEIAGTITTTTPNDYYKCIDGIVETPDDAIMATMTSYKGTLKLAACVTAVSIIVLGLEVCRHRYRNATARALLFQGTITPTSQANKYEARPALLVQRRNAC